MRQRYWSILATRSESPRKLEQPMATLVIATDGPIVDGPPQGQCAYDEQVKLRAYARAGLLEYAIIDPVNRTLRHYHLEHPGQYAPPQLYDHSQTMRFDCLPGLPLPVGDLFAGAEDTTA